MQKLDMKTTEITEENIDKLAAIFPHCITEVKEEDGTVTRGVDFNLLKQEFSNSVVDGPRESYSINWPGKKASLVSANTPIDKTLRPCREESVNFDTTENLYIEGDNLEALKLLQESYLGKVKMIYIDPPYNTGKDFVYKDNYTRSEKEELEESGQRDSEGGRLVANPETNGRFHSDWLNMIYPRLKIARKLLKDDGVIFISIDEAEVSNLQKIMNELFGDTNYITSFVWQNKKGGGNDSKYAAIEHEYILMYAKNKQVIPKLFEEFGEEYAKRYKEKDDEGRYFWDTFKRKSGKQYYAIECPDGSILQNDENGNPLSWLRSESRFKSDVKKGDIKFEKRDYGWSVMFKQRMPEGKKPRSLILDKGTTSDGSAEILSLFNKDVFSNPKPVSLIKYLLGIILDKNDVVVDFFSGSATTSQSIIELNINNKKNKYILVQLPENLDENLKKFTGPARQTVENAITFLDSIGKNHLLTELAKERIRRAGKKIKEENADKKGIEDLDIGFRVLKIDSSNMKDVYYTPDSLGQKDIDFSVSNVKEDRTSEDLLFQVLLDWGVDLTLPIKVETIENKEVYFVDEDTLAACFEDDLNEELVKELAARKVMRVVFKESGFVSDELKINIDQIFAQLSPDTEVRGI